MPVATDVHTVADLEDAYNREFMAAADILFMSDEQLPVAPETWAHQVQARFGTPVVVIGLGAARALLAVAADNFVGRVPAVLFASYKIGTTGGAAGFLTAAELDRQAATGTPGIRRPAAPRKSDGDR